MNRKDTFNVQLGQLITRRISKRFKIELSEDYWYSNKINVYAVPNKEKQGDGIDIIVSPYPPSNWHNIYALKVEPKAKTDEPGFITDFSGLLKGRNINILKLQSNPTFAYEPFSFWLLVDLSKCDFIEEVDEKLEAETPDPEDVYHFQKRKTLIHEHLKSILDSLIDVVDVRGTQFLYNFVKNNQKNYADYWHEIINTENIRFDIQNYEGVFPKYVLSQAGINRSKVQYSIISNPNQKTFFIVRVFGDTPILYLDVQHSDVVGSIHNISKIISDHRGNVMSATALIERAGDGKAHYFVLVAISSNEIKDMLRKLIDSQYVDKIRIYNYSDHIHASDIAKFKRRTKVQLIKKNRFSQWLSDAYKGFQEKNYFSLDVMIRVFFEKLTEILIFTIILAVLLPLIAKSAGILFHEANTGFMFVIDKIISWLDSLNKKVQ